MFTFKLIASVIGNVAAFAAILFVPAGTLAWWRACVLLAVVFIASSLTMLLIFRGNEQLLNERLKPPIQKKQPLADKIIIILLVPACVGSMAFIPLDVFRFHLMRSPGPVVSAFGLALFVTGWTIMSLSFSENAFAAPVVKHQTEQTVIDTGVYSIVRHPMYAGAIPVFVGMSLWLESYAAALLAMIPITMLAVRIIIEEDFLRRELAGYELLYGKSAVQAHSVYLVGAWSFNQETARQQPALAALGSPSAPRSASAPPTLGARRTRITQLAEFAGFAFHSFSLFFELDFRNPYLSEPDRDSLRNYFAWAVWVTLSHFGSLRSHYQVDVGLLLRVILPAWRLSRSVGRLPIANSISLRSTALSKRGSVMHENALTMPTDYGRDSQGPAAREDRAESGPDLHLLHLGIASALESARKFELEIQRSFCRLNDRLRVELEKHVRLMNLQLKNELENRFRHLSLALEQIEHLCQEVKAQGEPRSPSRAAPHPDFD